MTDTDIWEYCAVQWPARAGSLKHDINGCVIDVFSFFIIAHLSERGRGALLPPKRAGRCTPAEGKGMMAMVMRTLLMPSLPPSDPSCRSFFTASSGFFHENASETTTASASGVTSVNSAPNELIEDSPGRP